MGLGKTLSEIEHIGREELMGWMAFYELEPWGCPADDHRAELGLNLLFQINSKKGTRVPRFIDRDPQVKPEQTQEMMEENIRDFFMGRVTKKVKPRKPRKKKSPAATSSEPDPTAK